MLIEPGSHIVQHLLTFRLIVDLMIQPLVYLEGLVLRTSRLEQVPGTSLESSFAAVIVP